MKYDILPIFLIILLACLAHAPAIAAERLNYHNLAQAESLGATSRLILPAYAQENLKLPLDQIDIAEADLNLDGIAEFILRPQTCRQGKISCPHIILARADSGLISLGTIEAKTILLGNAQNQGVRNLMVFSNPTNDFAYTLFVWNPQIASFAHKDTGS